MTVKKLIDILSNNNIPEDAKIWSDCKWELHATQIEGVYYCTEENLIAFTQDGESHIRMPDDWKVDSDKRTRKWVKLEE